MTIVCNIWVICLELNWFVHVQSWMLHLSEFVWTPLPSVWVVFIDFLLIDATDRSNISSNQKLLFFAASLYPLSFFAHTPFKSCRIQLMTQTSWHKLPYVESFTFCTDPEIPEPVDTVDQGQIPVPSYKWYIAETCRIQRYIIPEPVHTVDQGQIPVPSYK